MKKIRISRNPNPIHVDKLNDISKQILISSRFLQNRLAHSKDMSNQLNYNIYNGNSNYITPIIKEKMLSMYSELSHRQNPLSTRINEYNSISTDNNNRMSYRQKGESFDKKKEEIMHLLKPNEIKLNKSKKLKHIQKKIKNKPKINLIFFQKSKHMNLKFTERMKLELDKILYKNENTSDENNNNFSKEKNKSNLKSKINQTINKNNSNKSKSISYRSSSIYIMNELKTKYGIKI